MMLGEVVLGRTNTHQTVGPPFPAEMSPPAVLCPWPSDSGLQVIPLWMPLTGSPVQPLTVGLFQVHIFCLIDFKSYINVKFREKLQGKKYREFPT